MVVEQLKTTDYNKIFFKTFPKGTREVAKIAQKFELRNLDSDSIDYLYDPHFNPGRSLDNRRVMERTFDLYNERILLKFHRENGQIFCKTVEFFEPRTSAMIAENKDPELKEADVKVRSLLLFNFL